MKKRTLNRVFLSGIVFILSFTFFSCGTGSTASTEDVSRGIVQKRLPKNVSLDSAKIETVKIENERIDSLNAALAIREFQEGIMKLDSQKYSSAIFHFRNAQPVIQNSKRFNAIDKGLILLKLGNAYFGLGIKDSALFAYQESIRYDFSQAEAFNNAGFIYLLQNDTERALQYFSEAVRLNPNFVIASDNARIAKDIAASRFSLESYALGLKGENTSNLQERIDFLTHALTLSPNFSEAENALAIAYYQSNEPLKAKETLLHLVSRDSSYAEAFNNLGFLEYKLGNTLSAQSLFQKARQLKKDFVVANLNLGICFLEAKNFEEALKIATIILKQEADNTLALSIKTDAEAALSQKKKPVKK
ncbi:MAG: tetratricopeptide repeat protein [Chloroherpetonaceae bacterium]|nr:tetratricopeptide repeat protein [Chloroherpetonaceae bacterium]